VEKIGHLIKQKWKWKVLVIVVVKGCYSILYCKILGASNLVVKARIQLAGQKLADLLKISCL